MTDDSMKMRIAKRLIRAAAKVLGVDMVAYDAEIARVEGLSPEELKADTERKLRAMVGSKS